MRRLLITVILLAVLSVVVLASASDNAKRLLNKEFADCSKNCTQDKSHNYTVCKLDYKNDSRTCTIVYNACLSKIDKSIDSKLVNKKRKNCTDSFTACKKLAERSQNSCLKNASAVFAVCKDSCKSAQKLCLEVYQPVCGIDNKTYPNQCLLDTVGVIKSHDGICNITKECKKDQNCVPFFSSCTCSWACVSSVPALDCTRSCSSPTGPTPKCACNDNKCTLNLCGNGKCDLGEETTCPKDCKLTCKDSDSGKDIFHKGVVAVGSLIAQDSCTYCTGACTNDSCPSVVCGAVVENYCKDSNIQSETIVCPDGSSCKDGACVKGPQCTTDLDCPQIMCLRAPCPQYNCLDNKCVRATCGNGICEPGEDMFCPACTKSHPACMIACTAGTCPEDCKA